VEVVYKLKLTAGSNSNESENIKLASSNEIRWSEDEEKTQGQTPKGV
jgi:hypothetical protein